MSIHVCKQCNSRFEYCRACIFRPIRYKDKGFCSKECYEASKIEIPATSMTKAKSKNKAKAKPRIEVEPEVQIIEEAVSVEVEVDVSDDITEEQIGIHE